jgi:hypothetical protein
MPRKAKLNTTSQTAAYESKHFNPVAYFWFIRDQIPFFLGMIDLMLMDDQVWYALNVSNAPFQSASVEVTSPDEEVATFVKEQFDRIWSTSHDKILRAKVFGYGGYEVVYKENKGLWEFNHLKDFHPRDIKPLLYPNGHPFAGHRIGMRVSHVEGEQQLGTVDLLTPNYLWLSYNSKYGSNFGESVLMRAYGPWKKKCLDGGAVALLQQYFFKHSMIGMKVRYPERKIRLPNGMEVSGRDLAREMMDMQQNGSCFALPSSTVDGKYEFDIEPPVSIACTSQLPEYIDSLDWKIFRGIVIPKEIVDGAGASGAGYAGRSFPMSVFLLARDVEFTSYVREINQQVIYPLVLFNFGKDRADYDVEPKSFLETFGEQLGGDDKDKLGDKPKDDSDGIGFDDGDFPSDDKPDDPDSQRNGIQFSTEAPAKSKGGTWITIGAQAGEDGKKHGGCPVKIDGRGRIIAGPSKFVGKNVKSLKVDKSKMGRHESAVHETAHKHRIKRSELHEVASQLWQDKKQAIEEREAAKAQVRKTTGMTQADIIRLENQGKDHTAVKGFDAVARQVASEHPELGLGRGYEQEGGYDDTDYASKLWDVLREGKQIPPAKHDDKLLDEAARIVQQNKKFFKDYTLHDDVPFALQFGAEHAPEGGVTVGGTFYPGGQFIPGEVIEKATKEEKEAIKGKAKKQKGMFDEEDEKPEFELVREPEKKTVSDKFDNTEKTKQKKLLDGLDALPGQQDLFDETPEESHGSKSQNFTQFLDERKVQDPGLEHGHLSPNGVVSEAKRARINSSRDTQFEQFREAQREFQKLVDAGEVSDPTGEFTARPKPEGHPYQWQADYMLRKAKEFKDLADRGMKPRTYKKESLKFEEAAKRILERTGGPDDLVVKGKEAWLNGERVGVFTEEPTKEKLAKFWESLTTDKNRRAVQFSANDKEDPDNHGGQAGKSIGSIVTKRLNSLLKKA